MKSCDRDLTVIIPTRNRAVSLRETLSCLARAERGDAAYALGMCRPSARARVTRTLVALERMNNYSELLRIAGSVRREWASGDEGMPPPCH